MHQGEHGDAVRAGFLQPPQVALEEIRALAAEQHRGAPVADRFTAVMPAAWAFRTASAIAAALIVAIS
jgi:hypothetical protein